MKKIKVLLITALLSGFATVLTAQETYGSFKSEEISFSSGDAVYSGTLSYPSGAGVAPLVILISGMGPQDRDWSFASGNYKMAKIISDYFNSKGIAVFRYDDRGFGKSTGTAEGLMSFDDLARDVEKMAEMLRTKENIGKVGLCGHSLGGILSVIAASRTHEFDFIITLSGSYRNGADIMREQAQTLKRWRTSAEMSDEEVVAQGVKFINSLVTFASDGTGEDTIRQILTDLINYQISKLSPEKMAENLKTYKDKDDLFRKSFDETYAFFTSAHQKSFVNYDAADDFSKITCPVLVLFGEMDKNVVVESNKPPVVKGLINSKIMDFTMKIVPGADHAYTTIESKKNWEMAPGVLDYLTDWIWSRAGQTEK